MLEVVLVMISGIFIGYLLRKKNLKYIHKFISVSIYLLLLFLGISVGGNPSIMNSLSTIGVSALIITIGALIGSCSLAWVVYKLFFLNRAEKNIDV